MTDFRNSRKNILIIDDSALMRRVASDIINADGRFRILDMATDGLEALDVIIKNYGSIDAVLLDINMPKMDGLELLERLNNSRIHVRIIMFSTLTTVCAKETIRALELGAFDFIEKPEKFLKLKSNEFERLLIEKLELATGLSEYEVNDYDEPEADLSILSGERRYTKTEGGQKLVVIAASTGGPTSLQKVIPQLPKDLDAPVLVVQHMPNGFTASFANRLNELSDICVKEAEDSEIMKKGTVYVAKGGIQNIIVKNAQGRYCITQMEEESAIIRPCADITLQSLLDSPYDEIICVVLTGMGSDATKGIVKLSKKKKVYVIAQDMQSCIVYGMPRTIANTGLVNEVVPLKDIAQKIIYNAGVQ